MNIVTLVLIVLVQILLVFLAIVSIAGLKDHALDIIGIPIHLIIVIFLNFFSLYILGKFYKREEKQKINNTEFTHIEEFRSLVASVRSDRHDLNNHLTVISGLMKNKNIDVATNYINEMIGEIRVNNKALAIQSPILASMVFSKMDKYRREEIPFELNILNEEIVTILSSTDLIRLVSNLLDNAYEATLELPKKEQKIQLEIVKVDENAKITVKNTSNTKEINEGFFEMGYSTKEKQIGSRGYGLAIILNIIDKYNGTFVCDTKDNLVCFEIIFPRGLKNDQ